MFKFLGGGKGGGGGTQCPFPPSVYTLQIQVGHFNHRVVTLVADKLKRLWL